MCIISTAQHASPKVMGQMDPLRAQLRRSSTFEITNSTAFGSPVGDGDAGGGARAYGAGNADADDDAAAAEKGAAADLWAERRARRAVRGRSAMDWMVMVRARVRVRV